MGKVSEYLLEQRRKLDEGIAFLEKEKEFLDSRKENHSWERYYGQDTKTTIEDREAE